jgi:hypothetical protein
MDVKAFGSFLLLLLGLNLRAATFSLTPTVVSNDYTGRITFQMSALSPGETVQLVQYYDFNSNGVVDADDLAVRGETVSDGQFKFIAGSTNINVFRDEDGATNGAITASFWFPLAPSAARSVGSYIFHISSPSNHFTAADLQFRVASQPYTQDVHGSVVNNSTNIPHALVALIHPAAALGLIPTVIASTAADASGNYKLKAPPGTYLAIALKTGYVANLLTLPPIVLATNASLSVDIPLMAATTTITGSLVDSANTVLPAVPYAEVEAATTNGLVALAFCDSNANFSIPVVSGIWTIGSLQQSANAEAYLLQDFAASSLFDTSGGPVNNAAVKLKHATALINGRVLDSIGNPVPGVNLFANADFGQFNSFTASVSNGFYSLAIDGGEGTVVVQSPNEPPASNFIWPTPQFAINGGQAIGLNVTGLVVTARFRSHVVVDSGTPLSGLQSVADSYEHYGAYTFATTDGNGFLDMPVFGGKWNFGWISALPPNLVFPDVPPFTITDGVNLTNDIVARTVTGTVSGYVHDGNGRGITNLTVTVTNHVGLTNYTLHATTDANGNYSVAVFNGTWNISPDNNALEIQGYVTPVASTNVSVPPAGGVANFVVSAVPPPQILTTSLFDAITNIYYSANLEVTNGSYPTFWSLTSGALPGGLVLNQFGYISGTPTNLGLFSFTVKVQDSRGSNDVKALSIRVDVMPTGPPQILTTYLAGSAMGCSFATQLLATNGTPPYSWALAGGSDPLPPGLQLATNGIISGTPTNNGYYSITVQVTGADNSTANGTVQIQVNPPLQYYPNPLSAGEAGTSYFGALSVSGGAQPQTWSVISGSLPPGFVLDPATGYITGMPSTTGSYHFTLRVTDGCATTNIPTAITNYPPLQIATTTLPVASLNAPYNAQLQAAGGVPPYSWYSYTTPAYGLTLNLDGSITGMAYFESDNLVTFVVSDANGVSAMTNLTVIATSKAILDLPAMSGASQFTFRVTGVSGQGYTLQSTPDLTNWTDLFTTNAPANIFYLTDTNASGRNRYYRLMESP